MLPHAWPRPFLCAEPVVSRCCSAGLCGWRNDKPSHPGGSSAGRRLVSTMVLSPLLVLAWCLAHPCMSAERCSHGEHGTGPLAGSGEAGGSCLGCLADLSVRGKPRSNDYLSCWDQWDGDMCCADEESAKPARLCPAPRWDSSAPPPCSVPRWLFSRPSGTWESWSTGLCRHGQAEGAAGPWHCHSSAQPSVFRRAGGQQQSISAQLRWLLCPPTASPGAPSLGQPPAPSLHPGKADGGQSNAHCCLFAWC